MSWSALSSQYGGDSPEDDIDENENTAHSSGGSWSAVFSSHTVIVIAAVRQVRSAKPKEKRQWSETRNKAYLELSHHHPSLHHQCSHRGNEHVRLRV